MSGSDMLYFLYNPWTGLVKVGITGSMEDRQHSLECAAGVALEVLGVLESASDLEIPIHEALFQTRMLGEWFRPSEDLLAIAKAPSRPAIQKLLEKYRPAVDERNKEQRIIDEAKAQIRAEQNRIRAEQRKAEERARKAKEKKAEEKRAQRRARENAKKNAEMESFRSSSAAMLEHVGLVIKNPHGPEIEREKQRERNAQLIGLRGGVA